MEMEQVNLLGETKAETLIAQYQQDRLKRLNGKEISFVPSSIWDIPAKNKYLVSLIEDQNEIREVKRTGGALGDRGIKFSEFKPDIAERVIEFWSDEGDLVIDPFCGRATRAIVTALLGRYYIGYEVVPKYKDFTMARLLQLPNEIQKRVQIRLDDGCELKNLADNGADLVFTCPPYWKLEKYLLVASQLSNCSTYPNFLTYIGMALSNCYRVLKGNAFSCWVVADWFWDGVFYPFHRDVMSLSEKVGFKLHDIIILKVYSPFVTISSSQNKRAKRMGKQHEYLIVAQKV